MPSPHRALAFVTLILCAPGCVTTTTETVPVQYRLPLLANSHGAIAARTCAEACSAANEHDAKGFYYCLAVCPDIQIRDGVACGSGPENAPPTALCFTRATEVERTATNADDVATGLGVILGLAEIGARIASGAHSGQRCHHR